MKHKLGFLLPKWVLKIEMFYLNTIEQLFLFVEQKDQLEVCLPYSRLLTGIPILAVFQNLRWNSNKTSLHKNKSFQNKLTRVIAFCTTLNVEIPEAFVFQLEVYYKVDRLLTGLAAQQIGTTYRWYSNNTPLTNFYYAFKLFSHSCKSSDVA